MAVLSGKFDDRIVSRHVDIVITDVSSLWTRTCLGLVPGVVVRGWQIALGASSAFYGDSGLVLVNAAWGRILQINWRSE